MTHQAKRHRAILPARGMPGGPARAAQAKNGVQQASQFAGDHRPGMAGLAQDHYGARRGTPAHICRPGCAERRAGVA